MPQYVVAYSEVIANKFEYLSRNDGLATILKVVMVSSMEKGPKSQKCFSDHKIHILKEAELQH